MKKIMVSLILLLSLVLTSCSSVNLYIGENGNWWNGDEDLGIVAQGPQGEQGPQGVPGENGEPGEKGESGEAGESVTVVSVTKTNTEGSVDTYTIYFSDNSSANFTVTNGTDGTTITITSVEKVNTEGLIDTYKIIFSDETCHTFTVKNGEDGKSVTVSSIGKTNSVGLIDTYEIVFSDGTKSTFTVTNGRDGNTPYIGANGNWWIGDDDTEIKAVEENMDRVGTDGLLFRTTIRGGVAGYEVYSYIGTSTDIVIPNYIFDQPVVSIAQDALPSKVTSISISSNTEWLPEFDGYTNLEYFDFNSAPIHTTAVEMFDGCSNLKKIDNYENIKNISNASFRGTKILNFDFSNVINIGAYAFDDIAIYDDDYLSGNISKLFVFIPDNVVTIGTRAFDGDVAVYYSGSVCDYSDALLYKNVKHSETGYYYIDNEDHITVLNYDGAESRITIPKTIDGKIVKSIADYAFYSNSYIERVEIPNAVTSIGTMTFWLCRNLHSVFIPESVENCGKWDDELIGFGQYGFENVTIFFEATSFDYPGGITNPEQLDLYKYMIGVKPGDVIDDEACVYVKKTLSYEVVTIKNIAGVVNIPSEVNNLPVSRINTYAMFGSTLTRVVNISDGIDKISTKAFYDNDYLKIVNIPNSVDAVNYYGFYSLGECMIYIEANTIPSDWDSSWYSGIDGYKLNSKGQYNSTADYIYEIVDGKVYLTKYLHQISTKTPIFVPDKVDGKTVYGIRSYCYQSSVSNSSSNKFIFVIPSTITVVEQYAISMYNYGYCDIYLDFDSSSSIPLTWHSYWCYSTYGYTNYATKYYKGQWELVDNTPVVK